MFGQAQGQKENPILAKPSQTLRGNAIFDRRICETGNGERGTGNGERGMLTTEYTEYTEMRERDGHYGRLGGSLFCAIVENGNVCGI